MADVVKFQAVGDNVEAAMDGKILVIRIDTGKTIGLSSTGKMMGVGSTAGFKSLPDGLSGNIWVGKPAARRS